MLRCKLKNNANSCTILKLICNREVTGEGASQRVSEGKGSQQIPQGVLLAAQPIQQVPLGIAVAEEGIASSSSLEEEIDKFQFEEEEPQGVEAIVISEAEEETDEYSCIQAPTPMITYVEDSSDNEIEEMAPKSNQSLRELIKGRNKVSTPQEANKSKPPVNPPPPPPQLPTDLGLKPNPELRRKRQHEAPEEGEISPSKGNKQQRVSQDQRSKRSSSVESQEDPLAAHVRRTPCIWSPKLELDGVPITWDTLIRNYQGGKQVILLRFWSGPFSFQETWKLIGTSVSKSFSYPLKGTWLW